MVPCGTLLVFTWVKILSEWTGWGLNPESHTTNPNDLPPRYWLHVERDMADNPFKLQWWQVLKNRASRASRSSDFPNPPL